jgi:hypothetical protein
MQPGGQAPAPQQPQATQSTPDLMNMYGQLMQRQQMNEGLQRNLWSLASSLTRSPTRARMDQEMAMAPPAGGVDAGSMMNNLMALQTYQLQTQQRQAFIDSAPHIAQMLSDRTGTGFTAQDILGMGPDGARAIVSNLAGVTGDPTTQEMNRERGNWIQQNAQRDKNGNIVKDSAGNPQLPPGVTVPQEYVSPTRFAEMQKYRAAEGVDMEKANSALGGMNAKIDETIANIDQILGAKNLGNVVGGQWLPTTGFIASKVRNADDLALAGNIQQLGGQVYGEGFRDAGAGGSRRSTTEVAGLVSGLSQVNNTNLPESAYRTQLQTLKTQMLRAKANNYAEAGLDPPDELKGYVDPSYYGQGGRLAGHTPPKQFITGTGAGAATPSTAATPADLRASKDPDADYEKLPSGATFIGPDGQQRRKP